MITLWQTPFSPFTSWPSPNAEFLYLSLSPYLFWFWLEAVYRLWGTVQEWNAIYPQLFAMAQIHSLPWAGIQLQDRCFTVLFIGFSTQRVVLHIDWEQVARGKGKKKTTPCFCNFFTVCGFLWHTDCSWMCKKAVLEVSMRLLSHHSHKNIDALGVVFFQGWVLLVLWPMGSFPFPFSHKFLFLGKAVDCVGDSGSLQCEIPKMLENHLGVTKIHPTLTMYLCSSSASVTYRVPACHCTNCHSYVGYFLSLSSLLPRTVLRMDWEMKL